MYVHSKLLKFQKDKPNNTHLRSYGSNFNLLWSEIFGIYTDRPQIGHVAISANRDLRSFEPTFEFSFKK